MIASANMAKSSASKPKKSVTIRLSEDFVEYFKSMAEEAGIPYQSLINRYLRDCLVSLASCKSSGHKRSDAEGVEVKPPRLRVQGEGYALYFYDFDSSLNRG